MSTEPRVYARVSRTFDASPERVFDAWLDARTAGTWMFAAESGEMVRAEIDPRVGGSFTFVDRRDGEEVEHTGEYLEIDRPRRLVFTFGIPQSSPDFDRVTVEIAPVGGGCEVTVTHEMDPKWAEYKGRTEKGWAGMLEGLAAALGRGAGVADL